MIEREDKDAFNISTLRIQLGEERECIFAFAFA